jgi:phage-related protein
MAYATFSPPVNPQAPMSWQISPRVLQAGFGDGYPQILPDGINTMLRKLQLSFAVLTKANFLLIDNFMTANVGKYFYYTIINETTPRLWQMTARTRRVSSTVWSYDVTLMVVPTL